MGLSDAHGPRVGALLSGLGVGDGRFALQVCGAGEASLGTSSDGSPSATSSLRPGFGLGANLARRTVEMYAEQSAPPDVQALARRAQSESGRPQPARVLAALHGGCWIVDRPWPPIGLRVPWPETLHLGVLIIGYPEELRRNERALRRSRPPIAAPASLEERMRVACWMTALACGDLARILALAQDRLWMQEVATSLPGWLPMESAVRSVGAAGLPSVSGATTLVLALDAATLETALDEGALRLRAHAVEAEVHRVTIAPATGEPRVVTEKM